MNGLDADGLLAALEVSQAASEVRSAFPGLEAAYKASRALSAPSAGLRFPELLAAALEAADGREILLGPFDDGECYVVIGGPGHGTWTRTPKWDTGSKSWKNEERRVWPGIAYREESAEYLDGDVPEGETLSRPVIIDAGGNMFRGPLMTDTDALEPLKVYKACQPDVPRWASPNAVAVIGSSLTLLRLGGKRVYQTAMGWHEETTPGGRHWHYNGTTGGISAGGPVPGTWRKKPVAERSGASVLVREDYASDCQRATGWPVIPSAPDDLEAAAMVIPALAGLTPGRPDIHLALLGTYFAAPLLGLAEKPAVNLEAEPESGKSKLTSCYHTLYTSLPVGQRNLSASFATKFSVPGIDGLRRSLNDAVCVLDDAAENNDRRKNEDMRAAVDGAIKAAYGTADAPMADGEGGTRVRRASRCAVIITSEKPLEGLGIESRALALPRMNKLDLVPDVDGDFGPLVDAGLPRQLYAAYIQWLAGILDGEGPDVLRRRVYAHKSALYRRLGKVRAVDVAGSVYAGLMMLGEFLDSRGLRQFLASEAFIDKVMGELTAEGQKRNAAAGIGRIAVDHIAGMIAAGTAYLEGTAHIADKAEDSFPADSVAGKCGWRSAGGEWKTKPGAVPVGYITDEDAAGRRWVLITDTGLRAAWRSADRAEKPAQVRSAWRSELTAEFSRKSDRPQVTGMPGSPKRGAVFDPAVLGIDVTPIGDVRALTDGSLPDAPVEQAPGPEPGPGAGAGSEVAALMPSQRGAEREPEDTGALAGHRDGQALAPEPEPSGTVTPDKCGLCGETPPDDSPGAWCPGHEPADPDDSIPGDDGPDGPGDDDSAGMVSWPDDWDTLPEPPGDEDNPPDEQAGGLPGEAVPPGTSPALPLAVPPQTPAGHDDGALIPENAVERKPKPRRPLTPNQVQARVEAIARKTPRVLPPDMIQIEGIA